MITDQDKEVFASGWEISGISEAIKKRFTEVSRL